MSFETFVVDLEEELHVGDVGTEFEVAVVEKDPANPGKFKPVDITGATVKNLKFDRGNATGFTKVLTIKDAAAGLFSYLTEAGTLDKSGDWKAQPEISLPGPPVWTGHAQQFAFTVYPVLSGA